MKKRIFLLGISCLLIPFSWGISEELPRPSYQNAVIISIEHNVGDSTEVDYIKNNFNFGLYAWLSFTWTSAKPVLDWHTAWDQADSGIQSFKNSVNASIQAAKDKNVKFHLVLGAGLNRGVFIYREAKEEDVRNCQWYNDNNIASDTQILDPDAMDDYIWSTLSRYPRKMHANLEAKAKAALAFLEQRMDEEPDVLYILSGWAESELNFNRILPDNTIEGFCDYSPFAVLEFRDWIAHTGMYDDSTGEYAGEGYSEGGAKYQGGSGLTQFNLDFSTSFTTWDLKYFNWNLTDDYDTDPTDMVNNDPNRIPYASYSHGNMMPTSGPNYIAGGFDPPRAMDPGNDFWDLWNLFRETMVNQCIKDLAKWASEAGVSTEHWFSHQIPADYLFGTNPGMDPLGNRYYTSASPLWTADVQPYGSTGATIYDIKFPGDVFARTTQYCLPAVAAMDSNWAIMEYDAETYPPGMGVTQSTTGLIYDQYMNIYNYNAHLINFWRWWDDNQEHRIKGMNKETALINFVEAIRDKGRHTTTGFMYDPSTVESVSGYYDGGSLSIVVEIGENIWSGDPWKWKDWGDFSVFEIHRSTQPGFTPDPSTLVGTTGDYTFEDSTVAYGNAYFYRVRALNSNGIPGPYSDEIMLVPSTTDVPILSVNRRNLYFGAEEGGASTSPENVLILNLGALGTTLNWAATPTAGWLQVSPPSGIGEASLSVGVNVSGLDDGIYTEDVVIEDAGAFNSPQTIQVNLTVYSTSAETEPFGYIDTPADGSTVAGSVPVTGWAIDDIEVTKLEIKRAPVGSDPPEVIGPDGLVYIGDAIFVKGARTDIETLYPTYPRVDRAGWGYMMLTNFLPDQGNGTFTLYALAYDGSGNKTELGHKMIICDNANSVLPFGTIDTPAQGGEASGSGYVNFGWVLTPQPKTIPKDGSTIWVWVDGAALGHPPYNNYRSDIATLFPGLNNSDGAVGYYYLDTIPYINGVHTIVWSAEDDQGAAVGLGSRYFDIQNLGGASGESFSVGTLQLPVDTSGRLRIGVESIKRGFRLRQDEDDVEAEGKLIKGQTIVESEKLMARGGVTKLSRELEIEQLERIEVHFEGQGGGEYIGWGADKGKPLPIGSTLDSQNGVFSWIPGPGFLGKHVLHFAVTDGVYQSKPTTLVVNIVPKRYQR